MKGVQRTIVVVNADDSIGRCRLLHVTAMAVGGAADGEPPQLGAIETALPAHDGGPRISLNFYGVGGLTVREWRALIAKIDEQLEAFT